MRYPETTRTNEMLPNSGCSTSSCDQNGVVTKVRETYLVSSGSPSKASFVDTLHSNGPLLEHPAVVNMALSLISPLPLLLE